MPDYSSMTIAELEAELIRQSELLASVQDARMALIEVITRRKAEVTAKAKIAQLTRTEKDALRTVLALEK